MQSQSSTKVGNSVVSATPQLSTEIHNDPGNTTVHAQPIPVEETRYVGFTHWSGILDDINELKVVLGESVDLQGPPESDSLEALVIDSELIFGLPSDYSLPQIISQRLPLKVEIDRSLSLYFQGESFIIPFIHTAHFQRQYREFWADPTKVNPLWLSMLLSICCMASLIRGATESNKSALEDMLTESYKFHALAGQCLVLGEYHKPQQFVAEALTLYAHCKNLRSLDPSREAGAILSMVVRMAYEMGYHRDPDFYGSFTVFEGEMRRRFWATCKQMDLMISFQLGLPSNICLENCDTKSPRNLSDSDFDADTQRLPESRSENEATRLLWFIVKERQMASFSKVCRDALSFREKSEEQILELDQEIRQMQMTIPEVLRTRPLSESIADSPFLIMTRIYVEFIYLKSLCVLHRRYMARGNNFSTRTCIEAGKKLVSQFIDMYKEFASGGQLYTERWMLGNFTMNDFLLGVMVLSLGVHSCRKGRLQQSAIDPITESELLLLLEQSHAICVEKSKASRDARRVACVVRLILNGAQSVNALPGRRNPASQISLPTSLGMQSAADTIRGVDLTPLSPKSQHRKVEENGMPFAWFDGFNFLSNDFEDFDWTLLDSQITSNEGSFTVL